jgi:hypothetical protein
MESLCQTPPKEINPFKRKYHNKDLNISYNDGYEEAIGEILEFIESERDNGNISGEKGFSASLCLSKLLKNLKKKKCHK